MTCKRVTGIWDYTHQLRATHLDVERVIALAVKITLTIPIGLGIKRNKSAINETPSIALSLA
jgi:hypothetical protein